MKYCFTLPEFLQQILDFYPESPRILYGFLFDKRIKKQSMEKSIDRIQNIKVVSELL